VGLTEGPLPVEKGRATEKLTKEATRKKETGEETKPFTFRVQADDLQERETTKRGDDHGERFKGLVGGKPENLGTCLSQDGRSPLGSFKWHESKKKVFLHRLSE